MPAMRHEAERYDQRGNHGPAHRWHILTRGMRDEPPSTAQSDGEPENDLWRRVDVQGDPARRDRRNEKAAGDECRCAQPRTALRGRDRPGAEIEHRAEAGVT